MRSTCSSPTEGKCGSPSPGNRAPAGGRGLHLRLRDDRPRVLRDRGQPTDEGLHRGTPAAPRVRLPPGERSPAIFRGPEPTRSVGGPTDVRSAPSGLRFPLRPGDGGFAYLVVIVK